MVVIGFQDTEIFDGNSRGCMPDWPGCTLTSRLPTYRVYIGLGRFPARTSLYIQAYIYSECRKTRDPSL